MVVLYHPLLNITLHYSTLQCWGFLIMRFFRRTCWRSSLYIGLLYCSWGRVLTPGTWVPKRELELPNTVPVYSSLVFMLTLHELQLLPPLLFFGFVNYSSSLRPNHPLPPFSSFSRLLLNIASFLRHSLHSYVPKTVSDEVGVFSFYGNLPKKNIIQGQSLRSICH